MHIYIILIYIYILYFLYEELERGHTFCLASSCSVTTLHLFSLALRNEFLLCYHSVTLSLSLCLAVSVSFHFVDFALVFCVIRSNCEFQFSFGFDFAYALRMHNIYT